MGSLPAEERGRRRGGGVASGERRRCGGIVRRQKAADVILSRIDVATAGWLPRQPRRRLCCLLKDRSLLKM